jgi:hypothetical protein
MWSRRTWFISAFQHIDIQPECLVDLLVGFRGPAAAAPHAFRRRGAEDIRDHVQRGPSGVDFVLGPFRIDGIRDGVEVILGRFHTTQSPLGWLCVG